MLSNRSLAASAAIQIAGVAATFAASVVISKTMGASGQGYWATIRSAVDLAAVVLSLGLPSAFPYFLNNHQVAGTSVARFSVVWSLACFPILALIMFAAERIGVLQLGLSGLLTTVLLSAAGALVTSHALWRGLCLANSSTSVFNVATVSLPIAQLLLIVVLAPRNPQDLLVSATLGPLTAVAISVSLWQAFHTADAQGTPRRIPYLEFARFGGWNLVIGAVTAAQPALAIALLTQAGSSKEAIGHFSIAQLTMGALLMPANLLGPMIYNAWTRIESQGAVRVHYLSLFRTSMALAFATSAVAFAALPVAIEAVFGPDFASAIEPARILVLAVPAGYASRLMVNVLMSRGAISSYAFISIVRTACVAIIMLMLPELTIVSGAWAWLCGEVFALGITTAQVCRSVGWPVLAVLGMSRK